MSDHKGKSNVKVLEDAGLLSTPPNLPPYCIVHINEKLTESDIQALIQVGQHLDLRNDDKKFIERCNLMFCGF